MSGKSKRNIVLWAVVIVLVVGGLVLIGTSSTSAKLEIPQGATKADVIAFENYYKDKMPMKYQIWKDSPHGQNGVSCASCHGTEILKDEDLAYGNFQKVPMETCGACHEEQLEGYSQTRHVVATNYSQGNARYKLLDAWPAMKTQGCDACHTKIDNNCTCCHNAHNSTVPKSEKLAVKDQQVTGSLLNGCENCHMGPDHPQREAYESSVHHQVALVTGEPTCITCHTDPSNNHLIIQLKDEYEEAGRQMLWDNCLKCHSQEFVNDSRDNVEQVKKETLRIVNAARKIIQDLYRDGILEPTYGSLLNQEGIPLLNAKTLGYSHVSQIESVMFELFKYAEATTIKGAQHFAPDYAHWHGAASLWQYYQDIENEANRLRLEHALKEATGVSVDPLPKYKYERETGHELDSLK